MDTEKVCQCVGKTPTKEPLELLFLPHLMTFEGPAAAISYLMTFLYSFIALKEQHSHSLNMTTQSFS